MTKVAINHAPDAQGFTAHIKAHIKAAHLAYVTRRMGSTDPGYAIPDPKQSGVRRMPMIQVAMERYQRDQLENTKR